ncbi:TrmH family RNA methyltransferase [Miniphocaeibacter massiliensis]|uniref:TrmH family RNA methyltransferase n=1 Tax=Miniphocaeibacter massiliensis TaxID=2041841 RepID=UPI000C1BAB7D|nr:TrmH family RNA methyltransferase [Miniphocaeibacter massiliensis]
MEKLKQYKKDFNYSYTLGPFPTFELIKHKGKVVDRVILSEDFNEIDKITNLLKQKNIPYYFEPKTLDRIGNKKKIFVAGVFNKYEENILEGNHLVLDNISDMGNLGTIVRTMVAFDIKDLALIGNSCDIFNPKVVRGSMGALFNIRFQYFNNINDYKDKFKNNLYAFMLSEKSKNISEICIKESFSLIFGNEGSGLGKDYETEDINKVIIEQSENVDSLNLTIAAGIGMYNAKMRKAKDDV